MRKVCRYLLAYLVNIRCVRLLCVVFTRLWIFKAQSTLILFQTKRSCFTPDTAIVHTTTLKTITENGAIRKRSPEWSDLKTCFLKTLLSGVDGENDAI